jgi:hypothetical protein
LPRWSLPAHAPDGELSRLKAIVFAGSLSDFPLSAKIDQIDRELLPFSKSSVIKSGIK